MLLQRFQIGTDKTRIRSSNIFRRNRCVVVGLLIEIFCRSVGGFLAPVKITDVPFTFLGMNDA